MADLLIKGMEMPKDGDYLFSFASDEYGGNTVCRIERVGCRLIEHNGIVILPTHGRLIDADEVRATMEQAVISSHIKNMACLYIDDATTVIEASEDGEQDG